MKPMGLTINDTGKAFGGLSRATVYRMANRQEIELVRIGGRSIITMKSIEARLAKARIDAGLDQVAA